MNIQSKWSVIFEESECNKIKTFANEVTKENLVEELMKAAGIIYKKEIRWPKLLNSNKEEEKKNRSLSVCLFGLCLGLCLSMCGFGLCVDLCIYGLFVCVGCSLESTELQALWLPTPLQALFSFWPILVWLLVICSISDFLPCYVIHPWLGKIVVCFRLLVQVCLRNIM